MAVDVGMVMVPVVERLPAGFDALRQNAHAEGHRNMDRLAEDWASGAQRFDAAGEALLAALVAGELACVGGITADPMMPGALRMRRFYVRTVFRRHGVGRRLAETLIASVHPGVRLSVNAGTQQAARFWEALGFMPDRRAGHTHTLPRRGG
jgi:GNAT superfamily N-acetyltransferase